MKKTAAILLTLLYLLPAIGFSIDAHWCGNKIQAIKVNAVTKKECSCGKKMPKGCCKNVHSHIQLTDNHNGSSTVVSYNNDLVKLLADLPVHTAGLFVSRLSAFNFTDDHAPPGGNKLPVYLTNCTFRI